MTIAENQPQSKGYQRSRLSGCRKNIIDPRGDLSFLEPWLFPKPLGLGGKAPKSEPLSRFLKPLDVGEDKIKKLSASMKSGVISVKESLVKLVCTRFSEDDEKYRKICRDTRALAESMKGLSTSQKLSILRTLFPTEHALGEPEKGSLAFRCVFCGLNTPHWVFAHPDVGECVCRGCSKKFNHPICKKGF